MAIDLQQRVAVITGGANGIGRQTALTFAEAGAAVAIWDLVEPAGQALVDEIRRGGGQAAFFSVNVTDTAGVAVAVAGTLDLFGRIDILINNAGVGNYKNLVETSAAEYDDMMDSNVKTTFLFSRHVVPVMIKQQSGLVLMVSSMAGVYGFAGEATYCATKFAQVGFAQGLDKELRPHGIKVGTICPGGVKTEFAIGQGRTEAGVEQSEMLEAEDVAQAILFACTQATRSRIIQIQMRTMAEALA